ncbi:hypothetical protein [Candidatus Albibeggiatoa sp. nov. BB20]|uniref:hypothetical protein n=1 Tax=Candidatus Albibeggiatoa sp. nov. BB20 TaxID=3162723 RepID=UPI003365826F
MLSEMRVINLAQHFKSNYLASSSEEGKLTSQLRDKQETVQSMLLDGMSVALTAKIARLSIEQVEEIRKNLTH